MSINATESQLSNIDDTSIIEIQINWMTVKEAASYLRISEAALRTLICRYQDIPRYKLGRSIRLKKDDLDKLLESSCVRNRRAL